MKRCRQQTKDLHIIFIDLKKAYDKVTRNINVVSFAEAQSLIKVHYPH
jgi:hypothetical protein